MRNDNHDSREQRSAPKRNSGNFTRGGQLVTHDWRMTLGSAKVPFFVWLGIVVAVYWLVMYNVMGEHEVQLVAWRVGSWLWTAIGLSPFKPMNIVLTDDSIRQVSIGYIPYVPDVAVAWDRATNALLGSLFGGTALALAPATWFIVYATKEGAEALDETHERGASLVSRSRLVELIQRFNQAKFEQAAARLFPRLKPAEVKTLPFARRRAAGLHHPYTLGGIPYPYGLEQSHTIVVGTTGAGKTTQLKSLVAEMRARGDSAVIFDLTGSFIESFYDPETDIILNPSDERCPCWSVFEDCTTQAEFTAAAQALIPHDGGGGDPFWVMSARLLFVQMCMKLRQYGLTTNADLADTLIKADLKTLHKILIDTSAAPLTSPDAAKMAQSIRSVFTTNADALSTLPQDGEFFSIREWVLNPDKPGSILFVSARYIDLPLYKTMLTLFLDIAVNTLMTLPRTQSLRTWYMFDELGALHRLPAIENGLQTARGFGGAMVLGMHSFARLQAVYGKEGAENMTSLVGSKLVLKTGDRKTAETCSEFIGFSEVRQMDEAYSYGNNPLRDGATLTPRTQIEALVIPDTICDLPSLHGYVKFPDGFPAARVALKWVGYADVAPGFIGRAAAPQEPTDAANPLSKPLKGKAKPTDTDGTEPAIEREGPDGETTELTEVDLQLAEITSCGGRQQAAGQAAARLIESANLAPKVETEPTQRPQSEQQIDGDVAHEERKDAPSKTPAEPSRADIQRATVPVIDGVGRWTREARLQAAFRDAAEHFSVGPDDGQDMEMGD